MLIVGTGYPTIATHIEVSNTPVEVEYREEDVIKYSVVDENSNIIKKDEQTLDSSSLGTFDILIIFLGNETYKSCFYNEKYFVIPVVTEIVNVKLVSEYQPTPLESLRERLSGTYRENPTYEGTSARIDFDVQKTRSGKLIQKGSQKLDTSKIGYNQIELTYEGNETSSAAVNLFRYKVIERISFVANLQIMLTVIIGILAPVSYRIYQGWKKRQEKTQTSKLQEQS
jgi:hypothetical protein